MFPISARSIQSSSRFRSLNTKIGFLFRVMVVVENHWKVKKLEGTKYECNVLVLKEAPPIHKAQDPK